MTVVLSWFVFFFFVKQKTAYELRISDWSSDVCSSDLQQLKDPAQEKRAKALMEELRCLVCQGQSIADSDAPLAGDMRHEVRTKIAAGESPDAIKAWLVARYGNWVSYGPPFDGATAFLWLGPLLFLAIGGRSEERRVGKEWVGTCRY